MSSATLAEQAELLPVGEVAELLKVSERHVWRLADSGRMPAPVRLGKTCRWSRAALVAWITGGCLPIRGGAR